MIKRTIVVNVLRYGSALMGGGTIVRIVTSLLLVVVYWKVPKRDIELTKLVLAIYADRVLLVVVVIALVVVLEKSRTIVGVI